MKTVMARLTQTEQRRHVRLDRNGKLNRDVFSRSGVDHEAQQQRAAVAEMVLISAEDARLSFLMEADRGVQGAVRLFVEYRGVGHGAHGRLTAQQGVRFGENPDHLQFPIGVFARDRQTGRKHQLQPVLAARALDNAHGLFLALAFNLSVSPGARRNEHGQENQSEPRA